MKQEKELYSKGHLVFTFLRGLNTVIEEDIRIRLKNLYGLTYPTFKILWILSFDKKMTMSEIKEITLTNLSNTYRQLLKLSDLNIVTIGIHEDARVREISLTEKGKELVDTILNEHSHSTNLHLFSILLKIPENDLKTYIEVSTYLSKELLGKRYTDWAIRTSDYLKEI
ncbi:hypothetical protein SM124_14095 [Bacillus sp. 31A1R]|uniref:HTH marR-type domain-containing protein n=1 Tax=Robertmurraya mangrovi TaxID=3098077 RepID=A0ABU5J0B4_9BACI|nr:hypothetical protein [Bacillus sp. 31A1R]MDZ5472860.1 hypothetical protein [Bacillus sp. 31A1R]